MQDFSSTCELFRGLETNEPCVLCKINYLLIFSIYNQDKDTVEEKSEEEMRATA